MILIGDCLHHLRTMPDCSVDSVVTDPPYGLSFMGKRWDYDVPTAEVWAECLRVLKTGGYLLSFAGTRTQHRMACRIEDAGFEIRDMIAWVYGSGFPKSRNGEWGGTALKPALEPITMARKPLVGTVEANWREHGTGALNIDACRIESIGGQYWDGEASQDRRYADHGSTNFAAAPGPRGGDPSGRWPANLIHDGSDEVVRLFPKDAGGSAPASGPTHEGHSKSGSMAGHFNGMGERPPAFHGIVESAARFFYCAKPSKAEREDGCGGMPTRAGGMVSNTSGQHITRRDGGAPGQRANHHPTVKPTELMRYLCRLVTPTGGTVLDPFMGSGSTGRAAVLDGFDFIGIELDPDYAAIAEARIRACQPGLALGAA